MTPPTVAAIRRCGVGVDIGGTFTDVVVSDETGILGVSKVLTSAGLPAETAAAGVTEALAAAGRAPGDVERVVHGTTLVTNAILEHRDRNTVFVTTRGFRHLLALGRHARIEAERYDLAFTLPPPPVPLDRTFEVEERIGPRGEVIAALDEPSLAVLADTIAGLAPASVAVCLINSHANPAHEARIGEVLRARLGGTVAVVCSCEISPGPREYERATTTVMSAISQPVMAAYLDDLVRHLRHIGVGAPLFVMDSAGGMLTPDQAVRRAVATIESGPAASVMAAREAGFQAGCRDVIAFDMGGTTAKAALITGGAAALTTEFQVGGRGSFGTRRSGTGVPVRVPVVDLAEVGAGGGSIAWVNSQGTLQVGPRSAGSAPGPACYGHGGTAPTVTDADAVLGYLDLRHSPRLPRFDVELARHAVARHLAEPLGTTVELAAAAVRDLVGALMADAIDVVTVQRGVDPRRYGLVCSGGAGPLHAARLAERFGIPRIIVPPAAGVASAAGMLAVDLPFEATRLMSAAQAGTAGHLDGIEREFQALESAVADELAEAGHYEAARLIDLRYRGQTHTITIDVDAPMTPANWAGAVDRFARRYQQARGGRAGAGVEAVQLRVRGTRETGRLPVRQARPGDQVTARPGGQADQAAQTTAAVPRKTRPAWSQQSRTMVDTPVLWRPACPADASLTGPVIVESPESTLFIPPGWQASLSADGAAVLRYGTDAAGEQR